VEGATRRRSGFSSFISSSIGPVKRRKPPFQKSWRPLMAKPDYTKPDYYAELEREKLRTVDRLVHLLKYRDELKPEVFRDEVLAIIDALHYDLLKWAEQTSVDLHI
jgi:hypothetical protein